MSVMLLSVVASMGAAPIPFYKVESDYARLELRGTIRFAKPEDKAAYFGSPVDPFWRKGVDGRIPKPERPVVLEIDQPGKTPLRVHLRWRDGAMLDQLKKLAGKTVILACSVGGGVFSSGEVVFGRGFGGSPISSVPYEASFVSVQSIKPVGKDR